MVDSRQANVASLPAAVDVDGNGKLDDYVTIVAPEGTSLTNVRALKVPTDTPPPEGVKLPYGLFDYDVNVAQVGDAADVTLRASDGSRADERLHAPERRVDRGHATRPQSTRRSSKVTVALKDGAEGDADKKSDGVIKDPVGVGSPGDAGTFTIRKDVVSERGGIVQLHARALYRDDRPCTWNRSTAVDASPAVAL